MIERHAGRGGFTLIEVLIAITVLVGGMVSILALFTTSASIHRSAVDDARTAMVAEAALDRVREIWNETGDLARLQALEFDDPAFRPYGVALEISPYAGNAEALGVVIRISWSRGSGERSVQFESVVLRDGFASSLRDLRSGRAGVASGAKEGGS